MVSAVAFPVNFSGCGLGKDGRCPGGFKMGRQERCAPARQQQGAGSRRQKPWVTSQAWPRVNPFTSGTSFPPGWQSRALRTVLWESGAGRRAAAGRCHRVSALALAARQPTNPQERAPVRGMGWWAAEGAAPSPARCRDSTLGLLGAGVCKLCRVPGTRGKGSDSGGRVGEAPTFFLLFWGERKKGKSQREEKNFIPGDRAEKWEAPYKPGGGSRGEGLYFRLSGGRIGAGRRG